MTRATSSGRVPQVGPDDPVSGQSGERGNVDGGLVRVWARHGRLIGSVGIVYLAIAATGRLAYALPHLLRDVAPWSALDLKYRYNEVGQWFAGNQVYGILDGAVYPPASYAILWPLLGWMPLDRARLVWAVSTLAAAAAVGLLVYRLCASAAPRNRLLVAGLAFAAYPLQLSIFVGQLGIHLVAAAAWGAFLILRDEPPGWWTDALAGLLLAASLVKPTLSVPLVVCALLASSRARPAILVASIYLVLTLIAVAAQPEGLLVLLRDWLEIAGRRVTIEGGVPNLHQALAWAGVRSWMAPSSLFMLSAMTLWMWHRREADPWVLMGVAAIVARFWAHSALYDDGFLLLAMVALFRVVSRATADRHRAQVWLFAVAWGALLTPTWFFFDFNPPLVRLIHSGQAILWLAVMVSLMAFANVRPVPTPPRSSE